MSLGQSQQPLQQPNITYNYPTQPQVTNATGATTGTDNKRDWLGALFSGLAGMGGNSGMDFSGTDDGGFTGMGSGGGIMGALSGLSRYFMNGMGGRQQQTPQSTNNYYYAQQQPQDQVTGLPKTTNTL